MGYQEGKHIGAKKVFIEILQGLNTSMIESKNLDASKENTNDTNQANVDPSKKRPKNLQKETKNLQKETKTEKPNQNIKKYRYIGKKLKDQKKIQKETKTEKP